MIDIETTISDIKKNLLDLLQTNDDEQVLDSLENMVVQSYLSSLNISNLDKIVPKEYTLKGWIECIREYLKAGLHQA